MSRWFRVDPPQRDRLAEIVGNLTDRIAEARVNGWMGEVQGLTVSRDAAAGKLATLDKMRATGAGASDLGMPSVRGR